MNSRQQTLRNLRSHIADCDSDNAKEMPRLLYGYIGGVLQNEEPSVYVIECIPALSMTAQVFLRAIGAFDPRYTSDIDVDLARQNLLDTLAIFEDELRLSRESRPALLRHA